MKLWKRMCLALLCCCLALAFAVGEETTLKLGDTGKAVLELNTRLRQLEYTTVRASDQYTASTETAVRAVQTAYGLEETGMADEQTLQIIYGECYRPLSSGASGEDVTLLQQKLNELGYYWGKISGNYLDATAAAVQQFQMENGLTVTGKADVFTQQLLFSVTIRPTATPAPATPTPAPVPTPGAYQSFKGTLSRGATGKTVKQLQQRLMDLGFFTYNKTTENYQAYTVEAVEKFQEWNGLKVTGIVDEKTWNAIFNDASTVSVYCTPKPEMPPQYFFEVDVKNQVVKVWEYNQATSGYTTLAKCFLCATGTNTYPSPLGTFTLNGERSKHCKFPNWGGGEARWWTRITSEIAFHSVLYTNSSDDMTLKVSSLTGLGTRGSHGCIRMTVADAKWIYDHATEGMQVWIHDDAPSDPELKYAIQPGELDYSSMMPKTTPVPTPYPEYDGTKVPETAIRTLSVGKEGEDVYWLQMKLKELGFYNGTVTGQYREGTRDAVKAYQRSHGLSADGTAGKETLNTLYKEVRVASATPVPSATQAPVVITVAPSTQTSAPAVDILNLTWGTPAPAATKGAFPAAITAVPKH